MRVIGLDPGLHMIGWGLITSKSSCRLQHIANGVISINTRLPLSRRLAALYNVLLGIISMYNPDEAAIEGIFASSNSFTDLRMSQARGIIILATTHASISISEYVPSTIKKTLVGNGKASKTQVSVVVQNILLKSRIGVRFTDATDALAVAMCHIYYHGSYHY